MTKIVLFDQDSNPYETNAFLLFATGMPCYQFVYSINKLADIDLVCVAPNQNDDDNFNQSLTLCRYTYYDEANRIWYELLELSNKTLSPYNIVLRIRGEVCHKMALFIYDQFKSRENTMPENDVLLRSQRQQWIRFSNDISLVDYLDFSVADNPVSSLWSQYGSRESDQLYRRLDTCLKRIVSEW
ncbi:MAG: hypothetical protein KBT04_00465 [Bacteroidales bacterium]|nr:hypothetical protein [Candidatus Colimorpha onthohippi]